MGRWEPDAAGRLWAAAVELFVERGYDETTVTDIAERAGLTRRTFFRYFPDKREVLFSGAVPLREEMLRSLAQAPADVAPMTAVSAALEAAAVVLGRDRAWSRRRQEVIDAHPDLAERESSKLAGLAGALAEGLRGRGVAESEAVLAAELGIAVFRVAFLTWVRAEQDEGFDTVIRRTAATMAALTGAAASPGPATRTRPSEIG